MGHRIVWHQQARSDLLALYDWIADLADPDTAFSYTSRIEDMCAKLTNFPERGTPRPDLAERVRTISFARTVIIAYRVGEDAVTVLRIISGARDMERLFEEE